MKIAFLCKRRYMDKDVVADRYGRLYEIPYQLSRLGHTVEAFCLDYQKGGAEQVLHQASPGSLRWHSRGLGPGIVPGALHYPWHLLRTLRGFSPDVVVGASDIPHVVLGRWLARRLGRPYVADLYDNFESFGQARIPGMVPALRRAVRQADLVLTTSEPLRRLVEEGYGATGAVMAMPSTVDKQVFRVYDKRECRRELGLPEEGFLIGTAGGLYQDKGVGVIYEAWPLIAKEIPDAHLVLAGPYDRLPPEGERLHYLGRLPHAQTARFFSALDVGVIYLRDTQFGRYCFPQKAYEMMACGLQVVSARVGVMSDLLASAPFRLYEPDHASDLARAVREQRGSCEGVSVLIEDWATIVGRVHESMVRLT